VTRHHDIRLDFEIVGMALLWLVAIALACAFLPVVALVYWTEGK